MCDHTVHYEGSTVRAMMWFTRDLRIDDQPALRLAADADMLLCVFVIDPLWFQQTKWQARPMGRHRWRFLWQSLHALDLALRQYGQRLHIAIGEPSSVITRLARQHAIHYLFVSRQPGTEEYSHREHVRQNLGDRAQLHTVETTSLFTEASLPFPLSQLPATFSQFRKAIEGQGLSQTPPAAAPKALPPPPGLAEDDRHTVPSSDATACPLFVGGEQPARDRLEYYLFASHRITTYKQTRNALDEADASSRLSPWLAAGTLSPRRTAAEIGRYEREHYANESTYWLWFELLWREFFHWYGLVHHQRLFTGSGVRGRRAQTSFYPHRYQAWTQGTTEWPLVNACMNQLRETGWISNRARQIVASCFVNELELDWRYGAAWFQEQLVDYDVGSNWGNWQYLAGVGADAKDRRWFNLEKQQAQFDPDGSFIERWQGHTSGTPTARHSVDAADWPVEPGKPIS